MQSNSPISPDADLTARIPEGATVKVIGLGGIGSIVSRYLTVFLHSLDTPCRLVIVDGDVFEPKNAARMLFSKYGPKSEVIEEELADHLDGSAMTLVSISEYVTPDNIGRLIQEDDIIILCVDNHATRKLVNDHCAKLNNSVLISGGNDGIEEKKGGKKLRGTYANSQIYVRKDGQDCGPSLTTLHPEIEEPQDKLPTDVSCMELMSSVPQILFVNLAAASAILNMFWLYLCEQSHYCEMSLDIGDCVMNPWPIEGPFHTVTKKASKKQASKVVVSV